MAERDEGARREPEGRDEGGQRAGERYAKSRGGVTTMVCLTCGSEKFFDDDVPARLTCDKCGSTVFRAFDTPTERDEATIARLEEQARSIAYDDASPETTQDEVRDLDQR